MGCSSSIQRNTENKLSTIQCIIILNALVVVRDHVTDPVGVNRLISRYTKILCSNKHQAKKVLNIFEQNTPTLRLEAIEALEILRTMNIVL